MISAPGRKTLSRSLLIGLIGGACGLILLALAVPRTVSAFLVLPADKVLEKILLEEEVSYEEMEVAAEAEKRALRWTNSAIQFVAALIQIGALLAAAFAYPRESHRTWRSRRHRGTG